MSLVNDLASLDNMENALAPGNALRNVLAEVNALSANIVHHVHQATSGTAISRYDPITNARIGWEIRYQDGNLGNLVHELTHAVTHMQYDTDGITYQSNAVATARTYTAGVATTSGGNLSYCSNEELRQGQFRIVAAEIWMGTNLERLQQWASRFDEELTVGQIALIDEKLLYGRMNILREYDTVINQILVWLHEWNLYPVPVVLPAAMKFPHYLEAAVVEAYSASSVRSCFLHYELL